jgi:hypothetical protein
MKKAKAASTLILISLLFCTGYTAKGQTTTRINSPYTLFGVGNLNNTNTNVRSLSMGGIKYGWRDNSLINPANPASYTAFDSISFLFEGALYANITTLKSATLSEKSQSASLNYLTFGFPVNRWWKSSFGLLPYSNVGYLVEEEEEVDDIGAVLYSSDGSGGLNQVYWGNGFQINKHLSLGFNASFIFGTIDQGLSISFPDSAYYYSTRIDNSVSANDFLFTGGLQYVSKLKKDVQLTLGLTYSHTSKIKADKNYLAQSFYGESSNILYYRDTIEMDQGIKGKIKLPKSLGLGFTIEKKDKWLVGADFNWQNWKEFEQFGESDSLQNRFSINIGGQITPNKYSIFSYWEKMTYRLGLRYVNSSLDINSNQLSEFGISFGIGFPVWKSRSTMNLGVEIGKWGTTKDNLVQENYVKFIFALSIYERWFVKPKYN